MYPSGVEKNDVKAAGNSLPISKKDSLKIARAIKNMKLEGAKKYLEDLYKGEKNLDGKHYSKASQYILETIESAEKNAEFQGLDKKKLKIKFVSVEKGPKRFRRFGKEMKNTHIKVVLNV